uniref:THAP-type domain-containing protein n=1 Tax=Lutzomyia longipalpis TaxID=7200 RepID=A0A1B0EXD4_LUTLO
MNKLSCNVKGCKYRLVKRLPRNVALYMLPRDAPEKLKAAWRKVCLGRLVACSEHFLEVDFMSRPVASGNFSRGYSRPLKHNVRVGDKTIGVRCLNCSVLLRSINSSRLKLHINVALYMLPRDAPEKLKAAWRKVCLGRLVACSEHFLEVDFMTRPVASGNFSRGYSRPLKHNVVPKLTLQKKILNPIQATPKVNQKDEIVILDSDDESVVEAGDPLESAAQDGISNRLSPSPVIQASSSTKDPQDKIDADAEETELIEPQMNEREKSAAPTANEETTSNNLQHQDVSISPKRPRGRPRKHPPTPVKSPLRMLPKRPISRPNIPSKTTKEAHQLPSLRVPENPKPFTKEAKDVSKATNSAFLPSLKLPKGMVLKEVKGTTKNVENIPSMPAMKKDTQKVNLDTLMNRKDLIVQIKQQKRKNDDEDGEKDLQEPPKQPRMENLLITSVRSLNQTANEQKIETSTIPENKTQSTKPDFRFRRVRMGDKTIGVRCLNCNVLLRSIHSSRLKLHMKVCTSLNEAFTREKIKITNEDESSVKTDRKLAEIQPKRAMKKDTQKVNLDTLMNRKDLIVQIKQQKRKNDDEDGEKDLQEPPKQPKMGNLLITSVRSLNQTTNEEKIETSSTIPENKTQTTKPEFRFRRVRVGDKTIGCRCLNCNVLLRSINSSRLKLHMKVCTSLNEAFTREKIKITNEDEPSIKLGPEIPKKLPSIREERSQEPVKTLSQQHQSKRTQLKQVQKIQEKNDDAAKNVPSAAPKIPIQKAKKVQSTSVPEQKTTLTTQSIPLISSVQTVQKTFLSVAKVDKMEGSSEGIAEEKGENSEITAAGAEDEDDDDVIVLSQKVDVIEVDDSESEHEEESKTASNVPEIECTSVFTKCNPETCEYNERMKIAVEKKKQLMELKEKLSDEQEVFENNISKIIHRHTYMKDFLMNVPKILTPSQKDIFFGFKTKIVWQHNEIKNGLMLRNLSRDLYLYLREDLRYPLPSLLSLATWEKQYPTQAHLIWKMSVDYRNKQSQEEELDESEDGPEIPKKLPSLREERSQEPVKTLSQSQQSKRTQLKQVQKIQLKNDDAAKNVPSAAPKIPIQKAKTVQSTSVPEQKTTLTTQSVPLISSVQTVKKTSVSVAKVDKMEGSSEGIAEKKEESSEKTGAEDEDDDDVIVLSQKVDVIEVDDSESEHEEESKVASNVPEIECTSVFTKCNPEICEYNERMKIAV